MFFHSDVLNFWCCWFGEGLRLSAIQKYCQHHNNLQKVIFGDQP